MNEILERVAEFENQVNAEQASARAAAGRRGGSWRPIPLAAWSCRACRSPSGLKRWNFL